MIVETQCARVLKYLKENKSITAMEALNELGIFRVWQAVSAIYGKAGLKYPIIGKKSKIVSVKNAA